MSSKLPIRPWLPVGPEVVTSVVYELGAIAFPILRPNDAEELAREAETFSYVDQPDVYGQRRVRQSVASAVVPESSELYAVSKHLESVLGIYFSKTTFASPLELNFQNIQRYAHGTLGIDPHYDESMNRNLIVLVALRGNGLFTVYEQLGGPVKVRWQLSPGTLLLMKAPGFLDTTPKDRPVHGVTNIVGDPYRYLLGLRQQVCG